VPVYRQFPPVGYLRCQAPGHDDIAALVALDQRALGGLWSAEGYGREIDSPNSCLLMLVHDSQDRQPAGPDPSIAPMADTDAVIGLGCYWAILDEAHITVLAIDPRYQRRGLGSWLLGNLLADACGGLGQNQASDRPLTRATLEVRPSNARALALYESFGFETLGRRRRYYTDGEDALILWQNGLKSSAFHEHLRQKQGAASDRLIRQGWQISREKYPVNRT
jgi:ribosomal-protein-alanine N-acetyltransferase